MLACMHEYTYLDRTSQLSPLSEEALLVLCFPGQSTHPTSNFTILEL